MKYIRNWEELSKIPNESSTHILKVEVENCCGWLKAKNPTPYTDKLSYMRQVPYQDHYLSTHSFYGKNYKSTSKLLHACGFYVNLDNWDKETP